MKKLLEKSHTHLTGISGYLILLVILQILVVYMLLTSVPKSMIPQTDTKEVLSVQNTMVEGQKPIVLLLTTPVIKPVIKPAVATFPTPSIKVEVAVAKKKQVVKHATKTLSRGGDITNESIRQPSKHEIIDSYVDEICLKYNMDPSLIKSIIVSESDYNPNCTTGKCLGLMQVSTRWHADRAERLNVTDFYDPYSNILLGVDYLSELFKQYKDSRLVLMLYNMNHDTAINNYNNGEISYYARSVLARAETIRKR